MAKLLDLIVAAEGFVPVAGRVYAQDGDGEVWHYYDGSIYWRPDMWLWADPGYCEHEMDAPLADDHSTTIVTAEAILAMRP